MPPQQPAPPPSPDPQYDFIFNEPQQPNRKFGLPRLSKPVLAGGILVLLIIVMIAFSIFGGGSGDSQPLVRAAARGQEIARVSQIVNQRSTDPATQALAATVEISLLSEQNALVNYMNGAGIKFDGKLFSALEDPATDEQMEQAAQESRLEQAYSQYLRQNLLSYRNELRSASVSLGPQGRSLINELMASSQTILLSPQLASATEQ